MEHSNIEFYEKQLSTRNKTRERFCDSSTFIRFLPLPLEQQRRTERETFPQPAGRPASLVVKERVCWYPVCKPVSIFLKDKVQNSNGRFVLPTSGPVPYGTQIPGLIRMFNYNGDEVKKSEFPNGGNYTSPLQEGSFDLYGGRVLKLGTNMYSVSRPVETHMSGTSKSSASHAKENAAPNPLAKEELNLLARLMGHLEVKKTTGSESGFRVNLFSTDEEEEEAAILRPSEFSYQFINIQATQDQQSNEELARIMGEFKEEDTVSQSPCSKGDDLLAMMDGL
ncbi:Protein OSCP1 [Acipenser ruthenus]|uniref:Protein OSCP1 n=1 Tax=Acipenser ruthenus TaxID=7906 RepID=A0A662YL97_ACIRT|nr:Protein OSCP1 [Acipenser ruthenus]